MPNRYFAGNSLAAFGRTSLAVVESQNGGTFDAAMLGNSLSVGITTTDCIFTPSFNAVGVVWTRFDIYPSHNSAVANGPTWMNGATPVARMLRVGAGQFQFQYWTGGAWANTGAAFVITVGVRSQIDVKINLNVGFEVWVNKVTLASSATNWAGGQAAITKWFGYPESASNGGTYYSKVMIADYDLRESNFKQLGIIGNGAYADGAGTYADVDEVVLDDSDAVTLTAVGQKKGFTKTALVVPNGYAIAALVGNARCRVGGGVVADGKIGCKSGANVSLSAAKGLGTIYTPNCHIIAIDPNTGTTFTEAGFNAAEIYLEAV